MKNTLVIVASVYLALASGILLAETDDQILVNAFHKYGITRCDKFILQNSRLQENWNIFISKHTKSIDDTVREASIIQVYGDKNDTVKTDDSYIQSKKACFLHKRSTVTFSGPCSQHVDSDSWFVSKAMPDKDYTQYQNKGGINMQAKEITVGSFKACIQEVTIHDSAPIE